MQGNLFDASQQQLHDAFARPDFVQAQQKPPTDPRPLDTLFSSDPEFQLQDIGDIQLPDISPSRANEGPKLLGFDQWLDLTLPPLEHLHLESDYEGSEQSTAELDLKPLPATPAPETGYEDAWHLPEVVEDLAPRPQLLTWEKFLGAASSDDFTPTFLSEAGAAAFDAALLLRARHKRHADAGNAVKSDVLMRCLWQLGLGRESVLFSFDVETGELVVALDSLRASGYSIDSSQELIGDFAVLGKRVQKLERFAHAGIDPTLLPARIGLASAVGEVLTAFEPRLIGVGGTLITFLQLQAAFEPLQSLTAMLADLERQTSECTTEVEVLNIAFRHLHILEDSDDGLLGVTQEIFKRMAQPCLRRLETYTGLTPAKCVTYETDINFEYPAFISHSANELIEESHKCLEFLSEQESNNGSGLGTVLQNDASVNLEIDFSWHGVQQVQRKAEEYQASLLDALHQVRRSKHSAAAMLRTSQDITKDISSFSDQREDGLEPESCLLTDIATFNSLKPPTHTQIPSGLESALCTYINKSPDDSSHQTHNHPPNYLPISQTLSLSLLPPIKIHHQFLTHLTLTSILHSPSQPANNLLTHLHLHHAFSLFSSGLFTARLSTVLFSTDVESAERSKSRVRTGGSTGMGLKLGSNQRDVWPPASSEVQLALRGVLGVSWEDEVAASRTYRHASSKSNTDASAHAYDRFEHEKMARDARGEVTMPGNLSFSIRHDLPPEIIEPILNPNSLHALDFLRLMYSPPSNLKLIFTNRALELYDRIFAFWLRMLRVVDALKKLSFFQRRRGLERGLGRRDADFVVRMGQEGRGIEVVVGLMRMNLEGRWTRLLSRVQDMTAAFEESASMKDGLGSGTSNTSLNRLVQLHEQTLQEICTTCLLRRRQVKLKRAWEELCQGLLDFVRAVEMTMAGESPDGVEKTGNSFVEKKAGFVTALETYVKEREDAGDASLSELWEAIESSVPSRDGARE
ncbi:MAG: hypothetical protein Q9159_002952 [Coniocarpon cinnabarinum]